MNRKEILNIVPDKSRNNSMATVKMVKDLETKLDPYKKHNVYRELLHTYWEILTKKLCRKFSYAN